MTRSVENALFSVVRQTVCKDQKSIEIAPEDLQPLYTLSKQHDMAHLIAGALEQQADSLGDSAVVSKFQKQQMMAVYRYQQLNYEVEQICQTLEEAQIQFLPLKGTVLRQYYPEPWMRTSCDIDVLVHESDLEKATALLVDRLQYVSQGRDYHDVSLFSSSGVHLELHFDLAAHGYACDAEKVLPTVWEHVTPKEGYRYYCEMSDEMFYFYHIAHMAKHFEFGGCGIRPFLDLWILEHCVPHDTERRNRLLEQGRLLTFTDACVRLSEVWFSGHEGDAVCRQMQDYVLGGGVYGTLENRVAMQQEKRGGKTKYLLSRIFLSYESLQILYPILRRHRWLTPVMHVRRWCRLLFKGRMKRSLQELNASQSISCEKVAATTALLDHLGLQ